MTIAILILMIYSVFGIHLTWTLGKLTDGRKIKLCTDNLCVIVAIILYCINNF